MADIQAKILKKHGIDIAKENVFKLYNIQKADISSQELQELIRKTRERWEKSINGSNEKAVERDRARLNQADRYEAILKDEKLRKELYAYYNGKGKKGKSEGDTAFAKEYFLLLATSKKIKKTDVDFFFEYYAGERKNKKAILEMLEQDFKITGINRKNAGETEEETEEETENRKKKEQQSHRVVNLFQKETVLQIQKCVGYYDIAKQNENVCRKYSNIHDCSLYEFISLDKVESVDDFGVYIKKMREEVYSVRQDKGMDFVSLVDLFNTLCDMLNNNDIVDNFEEFKLLVKYPSLTPYMFSFTDMKRDTLKGFIDVAKREYIFRDDTDFILNYYNPIHDNFGITNHGISKIIKKAESNAKKNELLKKIDKKRGREQKRKLSIFAEIFYFFAYWPIFLFYFIFEIFKSIFTRVYKLAKPTFVILFILMNYLARDGMNVFSLLKIFSKNKWYDYLENHGMLSIHNGFEALIASIFMFILTFFIFILPPLLISTFLMHAGQTLNKHYDWIGYERTFQKLFQSARRNIEEQYFKDKKTCIKKIGIKSLLNIFCVIITILALIYVPKGLGWLGEKTGYFESSSKKEYEYDSDADYKESTTKNIEETVVEVEKVMIFTKDSSNIRSGPGTEYQSIMVVTEGSTLLGTGKTVISDKGTVWYELYMNTEKTEFGWASELVVKVEE